MNFNDRPIYPVDAPGMAPPGRDFMNWAMALGDEVTVEGKGKNAVRRRVGTALESLYRDALYSAGDFVLDMTVKGTRRKRVNLVSGHLWGAERASGPRPADVMILGKMLGDEEGNRCRNLIGPTGALLLDTLKKIKTKGLSRWYITNLLKCEHPDNNNGWSVAWEKEFLPLLHQELRLVRPKFILCLGSDASKALLGKECTVSHMEGRVKELEFPVQQDWDAPVEMHKALVMTCLHPAAVLRTPELLDQFEFALIRFDQLIQGMRWDQEEAGLDHRSIRSVAELLELEQEIYSCAESYHRFPDGRRRAVIGLDAEWHGAHPQNKGAYIRSVQISWAEKKAAYIPVHRQGGKPISPTWQTKVMRILGRICRSTKQRPVRLVGHFLTADMEWLTPNGLDVRREFMAPSTWQKSMSQGGFDTGLAAHAIEETGNFALKSQSLRHTTAPRYDIALTSWIDQQRKDRKLAKKQDKSDNSSEELEGFGDCPDEILWSYGCYDADVARRIAMRQFDMLSCDGFGNNCWEAFWMSMRAVPGILEMNQVGVHVDRKRVDQLTEVYMRARQRLENEIRTWARWPTFNVNSVFQVREFLFGERFNGKERPHPDDPPIRLRPPEAKSLQLTPILSSDKRPVPWEEVVAKHREDETTPGTNKLVLSILAEESQEVEWFDPDANCTVVIDHSPQVNLIRNYRFISQILKSVLRPPIRDPKSDEYILDDMGHWVYADGLPAHICADGCVRTHIYPTKETRRWSSARPALQNLSKRREADYERILAEDYLFPLRSILCARPGELLVEADFIGAELYGMAMMAGDEQMIDHCLRNQLPEDDPRFYDIHSQVAKFAFRLDCEPTKAGLKSIGKAGLRIVAKSVIFGIAYGRGAKAIALAAKEEKVNVTVAEAQTIIDAIFEMYPRLKPFFEECGRRALDERWLCGPFGGYRRFPTVPGYRMQQDWERRRALGQLRPGEPTQHPPRMQSGDRQAMGEIQRQATNFPIQGMIADAMSRAIDHLITYRSQFDRRELHFDLALQIHDAVLLRVPYEFVTKVVDEVLPYCMSELVPIYPCTLDGTPTGTGPYRLGIDVDISTHWGVTMMPDECELLLIPPTYAHWKKTEGGWKHDNFPKQLWYDGGLHSIEQPAANVKRRLILN